MPSGKFAGQSVIITGAGQGIGFEIARQLSANGASVVLNDIDPQLADSAAEQIQKENGICEAVPGDASAQTVITQLINTAVDKFGKLDIAIANAGITLFGDFLTYSPNSFSNVMQVNLGGSFFLAQAAANQMIKQGGGGSILFMSSVTGHQ